MTETSTCSEECKVKIGVEISDCNEPIKEIMKAAARILNAVADKIIKENEEK